MAPAASSSKQRKIEPSLCQGFLAAEAAACPRWRRTLRWSFAPRRTLWFDEVERSSCLQRAATAAKTATSFRLGPFLGRGRASSVLTLLGRAGRVGRLNASHV